MASIESLLSELTPTLECSLALKAAEQIFFGDRVSYGDHSNVGPSSSKAADEQQHQQKPQSEKEHKKEKKEKKEKSGKDHAQKGRQDGLDAAISSAKKTISDVLQGGQASGDGRVVFATEIKQLKEDVENLKLENSKLRTVVDELSETVRKILAKPDDACCSTSPLLSVGPRILVIGDGNLSFSFALVQAMKRKWRRGFKLVASVLEDEEQFLKRYPSGEHFLQKLRTAELSPFVDVLLGVDACNLPEEWDGTFNDVIWNFPHPGGKTNLRKSKELLRNALRSVYRILRNGLFHVTFAKDQSGLDFSAVAARSYVVYGALPHHKKDSWQTPYIAAECGFLIYEAHRFCCSDFPEYCASGYRSRDQMFYNDRDAVTVSLAKFKPINNLAQILRVELEYPGLKPSGCAHELRPYYSHDLSIVYAELENILFWEEVFKNLLFEFAGSLLIDMCEVENMRCFAPNGLPNRIYRVIWQCWLRPLSKNVCNELQEELRSNISSSITIRSLPFTLT